ncbi:17688_t:CDS:2 [Cetraspora pellucida]|uniref:17688_t:CDS:1 n=1 Tax=Cetraspora pellucida TaxID=1433469 RepID=A0A9N9DIA2_9GLOM|nr:17688_t:CDS:2 [Cetraspora pellucida]
MVNRHPITLGHGVNGFCGAFQGSSRDGFPKVPDEFCDFSNFSALSE